MILVVDEVVYGEKVAPNGKMFSGYYLRGIERAKSSVPLVRQEYFIADLTIKINQNLALVKTLVKDDIVSIEFDKNGKVASLGQQPIVATSCIPTPKNTTQNSIERQNALTNATNTIAAYLKVDKDNFSRLIEYSNKKDIWEVIKMGATELLKFHEEIVNAE